ncbi:tripartite motif-containing protein 59-like isoform X3 [Daphnia pulex]|uniref:tripartite motif-containing protein 59-like isoform X3 n=1 Tax=Daphnia pulex TaxID=6669 RepID=UPI001EE00E43|nr:tripartite motif-containing protein 59-like isoform X3 [Daphnia pulex]
MIVFNRFREIKIVRQDVKLDTMATSVVHEADDLNTCAVCFEQYNFVDRLPKFLSCLHTFCISCLGKMLLDSSSMTIICPACRTLTSPGGGLVSLRTNEHALRVLELQEKIINLNCSNRRQPAWCHTCDELASLSCQLAMHSITPLGNDVVEKHLSQNQKNKVQLNLSYGILHEMEAQQDGSRSNLKYQRPSNQTVEDEAESAYSSALSLAQTFEGAKNVLISMNVETVDGKMAPSLPWLNRIKLCLMNQIDDKAVNAAGLNILSFILLLQLQQNRQQQQINVPVSSSSSSLPSNSNNSNTVSVLRSLLCPQQLYPNHQYCSMTVEVNFDRKATLLFQLAPQASSELKSIFIRSFSSTYASYFQSVVVKAGISLFVVFGSPYNSRSLMTFQTENAYYQRPFIMERGDVGLYYSNGPQHNGVSDMVILLAPFSDRNVRRAPLVARLVNGLEFCHSLSHLKLHERASCKVVHCGVF